MLRFNQIDHHGGRFDSYRGVIHFQGEVIDLGGKLASGNTLGEVAWSPDGNWIGFDANDSNNVYVYTAQAPEFEPVLVFSCSSLEAFYRSMVFYSHLSWVGE